MSQEAVFKSMDDLEAKKYQQTATSGAGLSDMVNALLYNPQQGMYNTTATHQRSFALLRVEADEHLSRTGETLSCDSLTRDELQAMFECGRRVDSSSTVAPEPGARHSSTRPADDTGPVLWESSTGTVNDLGSASSPSAEQRTWTVVGHACPVDGCDQILKQQKVPKHKETRKTYDLST